MCVTDECHRHYSRLYDRPPNGANVTGDCAEKSKNKNTESINKQKPNRETFKPRKKNAKALERKVTPQTHYTQIVFSGYACSFDIHVVRMPVKSVVLNCVKRIYDREINITFVIAN